MQINNVLALDYLQQLSPNISTCSRVKITAQPVTENQYHETACLLLLKFTV